MSTTLWAIIQKVNAWLDGSISPPVTATAGVQYTEGQTDATITGTAVLWEDTSDTLRAVSATNALPIKVVNAGAGAAVNIQDGGNTITVDGTVTATATGAAADGAAVSGNPVLIAGQDGTNVQSVLTDTTGRIKVTGDSGTPVFVALDTPIPAGSNVIGTVNTNVQPNDQWPPISGDGRSLLYGTIAQTAAGTTELVAADADELYYIVSYVSVLDAAGSFKFTDGTADLTGVIPVDTNGGVSAGGLYPLFKTRAVNRPLNIVTVTGKAFGHFTYYKASS